MPDYSMKLQKSNNNGSLNRNNYFNTLDSGNISQHKWSNLESNSPTTKKMEAIQLMAEEYDKNISQKKSNQSGIPNPLKSGVEQLSGLSMDSVKVHYNSEKPAQLNAHAYAQGNQIHIAPGQEQHLPHEAWHVVQQAQGRVKPTKQLRGKFSINDNQQLEKEADTMGSKAISLKKEESLPLYKLLQYRRW